MSENTGPVNNAVATRTAAPPAQSKKNDVRSALLKMKGQIAAALPRHITPDRMLRVALTAVNSTPELLKCDQTTLLSCVMQCAQLGLEPGGVLGHAYLLPYGNKCQLIVGYKGLLDLARRSGRVLDIWAHVVYENETFELEAGLDRVLKHKPLPPSRRGEKRIGVYAAAKLSDGSQHFEWVWIEEVESIRGRSRARNNGPWVTDYDEMARKTAIRRLAKYLPISIEFSRAAALDEAHEIGLPTTDLDVAEFTVEDAKPETQSIEKAFAAPAEKPKDAEKVHVIPTILDEPGMTPEKAEKVLMQANAPAKTEGSISDDVITAVRQAASRKGFNNGRLLQLVGATIGTAKPVDTLTSDEAAKMLEVLA